MRILVDNVKVWRYPNPLSRGFAYPPNIWKRYLLTVRQFRIQTVWSDFALDKFATGHDNGCLSALLSGDKERYERIQ
jgi:hypothetical protein